MITQPPFCAHYHGGPVHGHHEMISPAAGESLDERHIPIPPSATRPDLTVDVDGPTGPLIARYVLVESVGRTIGRAEARELGTFPGHVVTARVYEWVSTEQT